ncbi:hypothetical protein IT6_02820 [Methylacidiphilum caldifontis]|uniref:hypothetical protein n=1 Tax=Methylacidiphilum caldifontis TaxID=2795386 RepID=UPI001A8F4C67|nr:hypothetical protein [Methylacidiphilum caldifontis]QSR89234.1 hypothetical protein IT6_02820 [Methylacidiphilum caldifontis]
MKIHIFDVEHGECSAVETPCGHLILIGAGCNKSTNWRPSSWLQQRNQKPHCIVLSNLDQDHLSDLVNFKMNIFPESIAYNSNIDPDWLEHKKIKESGEVHDAVKTALYWIRNVFISPICPSYEMEIAYFHHSLKEFQDTNNLSVVTFVAYNGVGVMFPGDLEAAGWEKFLENQKFVKCLKRTNILIASHHGRKNGYCREVFDYCAPDIIIISDKPVMHETQSHNLYAQHCRGLNISGSIRKVLTTRKDGRITIIIPAIGNYIIHINQNC